MTRYWVKGELGSPLAVLYRAGPDGHNVWNAKEGRWVPTGRIVDYQHGDTASLFAMEEIDEGTAAAYWPELF